MRGNHQVWSLEEKWGRTTLKAGWTAIPSILLDQQAELGLSSTNLVVLAHLIRWWWIKDRWPFPSLELIATSMGVDQKLVRKSVARMKRKKLVDVLRQPEKTPVYDLSGLIAYLEEATERRLRKERK